MTTTRQEQERAAREDWERRIYRRLTDTSAADPALALPAPAGLRATGGAGHVRLDWDPVAGAAGYLIERTGPDGEARLVQHGGADVPAVPASPFADTGLEEGVEYSYRVAAVRGSEYPAWDWSAAASAAVGSGPAGPLQLAVDAGRVTARLERVWYLVGSERLTQLLAGDDGYGNDIGSEFAGALRIARADLGISHVRAHAILHDDNHVVTRADSGELAFDFDAVDRQYDRMLELGLRPVVEVSFMPAAIAADPDATVFAYRGIVSPPRDWSEWRAVVRALAAHLVERYGIEEVATWGFEIWNEPNLEVFWTGSQEDYLRLYDEAAAAIKDVDPRLPVGGPSTAAAEWVETLARHAEQRGVPLDFVTSHTYGNLPVDLRASLRAGTPIRWTEWGAGHTHFGPIHDSVIGAPFILSGYQAVQGRMDALAYWVISDHFEELGRPKQLFHNGFGLLTVGNLRKPRYWATHLAAHLGDHVLAAELAGDGADVLVRVWATRDEDGTVDVLVWNGTLNAALMDGEPRLDRTVSVVVEGLGPGGYDVALARVDAQHSNILNHHAHELDWPDAAGWAELRARDRLYEQPLPPVPAAEGRFAGEFEIPMPGVFRVRLTPQPRPGAGKEGLR